VVARISWVGLFIIAVATAVGVAAVRAQTPARTGKLPRVAIFVTSPLAGQVERVVKYFEEDMRAIGWIDGKTLVYDHDPPPKHLRDNDSLVAHANRLLDRNPDLIWVANIENALAIANAQNARKMQIPIVGTAVTEQIFEVGLANSYSRPGKNFTGVLNVAWELGNKRLELVHELMPTISRVGVLVFTLRDTSLRELALIEKTAVDRGLTVIPARIQNESELDSAFEYLAKNKAQAVLTTHVPLFQNASRRLIELANQQRIPLVGHRDFFADQGAVMAYGTPLREHTRASARMSDKILRGERVGNIPVERPTRFELVLNRKAAKALGIPVPGQVLVRVDRFAD
jgi:putative ABC transport system substrate-binding protein